MFEQKSLDKIDGDYFNIIIADSQDVTIQSRNTGHYWYLHCAGYPTEEAWEDISYELNVSYRTVHRIHASSLNNFVVPE